MSSTRCRITAQTADQCSTGGRPHEGYRDLRRALRLAPSSVHKYSFPEHGRSPRVRGDLVRPARLRSHPHLIDPLHAAVHSGPESNFLEADSGCYWMHSIITSRPLRPKKPGKIRGARLSSWKLCFQSAHDRSIVQMVILARPPNLSSSPLSIPNPMHFLGPHKLV